jgi:uncharacterized protein (TIGR03435 family)
MASVNDKLDRVRNCWKALLAAAIAVHAQTDWQAAAGGKKQFDAASVKLETEFRPPSYPLDNGNAFKPGGRFSAVFTVMTYLQFAYKVSFSRQQVQAMRAKLPKWVFSDLFAIEAKADGLPTKDQFRLMMQSLLAERFHLEVHFETQETAVYALMLVKSGRLGPKLRLHSDGPPCGDSPATAFPPQCYVTMATMKDREIRMGSRATTMDLLAESLPGPGTGVDRPVVDQTGVTGEVDFELDYHDENPNVPPGTTPPADPGPTAIEALREQLGLKLESVRLPLRILVVDRIERPSEN